MLSSNNKVRTESFARNEALEVLLQEINSLLAEPERKILPWGNTQHYPVILLFGPLRCGSTLIMQWLANTGLFAYPTNLLSRFYGAPIIGAKIQLMLTDPQYSFRNELGEFLELVEYKSENGKTKGALAPNEFWYFWRRFLADSTRDVWSDKELRDTFDVQTFLAELYGMTHVFKKPFAAKGMLFNYNIPFLDAVIDKPLFIQIKRDVVTNAASILEARTRQYGNEETWYSFKIPEYDTLISLNPIDQIVGQIISINDAVSAGIENVSEARKLVIDYEEFCRNPGIIFSQICDRLKIENVDYRGPISFAASRVVDSNLRNKIQDATEARSSV